MLEWNLPPIVFERLGTPGFFRTWVRPAVFVTGLVTNLDDGDSRTKVGNVGAQVDFRFSVLSALDMTFSIGGAVAFSDGFTPQRELMLFR